MVAEKEIIPSLYPQPPETLRGEQNSFLRFIDENKDLFDRHSSLTYELRDEEEGWRNSSTVDQIVNDYIDLIRSILPNAPKDKQLRKVSRDIRKKTLETLFRNPNEKADFTEKQIRNNLFFTRKVSDQQRPAINELYDRMDEFNRDFHEAKAPVAAEVQGSKAELSSKFKNYLLSDPSSIFSLRDFLSDKKYASNRKVIRPFLASFSQSEDRLVKDDKGGILGETVKKWVVEISEKATPDILDEFVASIKSPNILEWLEFAAQGEDIANSLKARSDFSAWPSELRKTFESFVASKYHSALGVIRKELDQLRTKPEDISRAIILGAELVESKKRTNSVQEQMAQEENDKAEVLKKKYPAGVLSQDDSGAFPFKIRLLTKEELSGFLNKAADDLSPSDSRMNGDVHRMVENLLEDPYGLGTEKIFNVVTIGPRKVNLRSMKGKGRGILLEHQESDRLRVIYAIAKHSDSENLDSRPVVVLEGIYHHNDFDKKFL